MKFAMGFPYFKAMQILKIAYRRRASLHRKLRRHVIQTIYYLSVRAPVGAIARSLHKACIGRGIASIKAKTGFSQDFLYQGNRA
jgi:hypothetical protein